MKTKQNQLNADFKTAHRCFFILGILLLLIVSFQNCTSSSYSGFSTNYSESAYGMMIENGALATNKQVLSVQFIGNLQFIQQMRLSTVQDMDSAGVAWVPYSGSTTFDLGSQWAQDHSQDGMKTIYVELSAGPQTASLQLSGSIGLDTVPPMVSGGSFLVTGLQGQYFQAGQSVPLTFQMADIAAQTGYSSGLSPSGFKLGYSSTNNCGSGVTWVSDWTAPQANVNMIWPAPSQLNTTYVCALIQDNAGNVSSFLSQPLTSIWKVAAGDNNSGDGETYNGPNVRFKYPTQLAVDSLGDLFVYDNGFSTVREINKGTGIISTIIGNGQLANSVSGPALQTGLSGNVSTAVDPNDNLYIYSAGQIFLYTPGGVSGGSIQALVTGLKGQAQIGFENLNGVQSMLILTAAGYSDTPADQAYLYNVPMSVLTGAPALPASSLSTYLVAGNGKVPPTSFTVPYTQVLVPNSGDDNNSIGFGRTMAVGPAGEIYISTGADPNKSGYGNATVRRLTFQPNGSLLQQLLSNSLTAIQLTYAPAQGQNPAFLLIGTLANAFLLNLTTPPQGQFNTVTRAPFSTSTQVIGGVITSPPPSPGAAPEFYVSVSTQNQVEHLALDAKTLIGNIGRNVYNASEPVGTLAMIGQPEGLVQDPVSGIIYFFDSINDVIRAVSPGGSNPISLVSGSPGTATSQDNTGKSLSQALYSGLSAFQAGGYYPMTGQFSPDGSKKNIFLGEGTYGKIHQLDLIANQVSSIAGVFPKNQNGSGSTDSWAVQSLAIGTLASGAAQLFDFRLCNYAVCGTTSYQFASSINSVPLPENGQDNETKVAGTLNSYVSAPSSPTGTSPLGVTLANGESIRVDSLNNLFVASNGFYIIPTTSTGTLQSVFNLQVDGSNSFNAGFFQVFENADDRIVIYASGSGLRVFTIHSISQMTQSNPPPAVTSQKLCLPGTFFKKISGLAVSGDQNLLISDASNARIIEYYLRDTMQNLNLQICN